MIKRLFDLVCAFFGIIILMPLFFIISFILCKSFQRPRPKHLQVIINSPGGDLNAAFAVIDIMRGCPIPVYTVGIAETLKYLSLTASIKKVKPIYYEIIEHIKSNNIVPNDLVILSSSIELLRNINLLLNVNEKTMEAIGRRY